MEITKYRPFIKEQFTNVANQYNLKWGEESNNYILTLENEKVLLRLGTFRRESGMSITLTNKVKKEYYYDFPKLKGFESFYDGLTIDELASERALGDDIKATVYLYRVFLENHCQDMLLGDFSLVGPGLKN
ncbi:hypothetical protein [Psychroserpens algicola]|uniref:hypothetical protein n=1 Tax=Psychroserpens algicola TaxID=1719034 RepID=UPI0019534332|nr:hypothetical protein [Psychroserpens algicola]